MLRARLRYFNVDRDIHSVLVTSAAPGEGKTTVAWNLAASSAGAGSRTILLEADFHQPSIAARIGIRPRPGLSELLSGQSSLAESVQQVTVENRQNGKTGMRQLDVIVAGSHPPNPVELLESDGMARLLEDLSGDYDLVVIDSPPLPILADAIPLAKMVNGVIIVGRVNKTTRDEAQALHDAARKPGRAAPRSGGEQDFAWKGLLRLLPRGPTLFIDCCGVHQPRHAIKIVRSCAREASSVLSTTSQVRSLASCEVIQFSLGQPVHFSIGSSPRRLSSRFARAQQSRFASRSCREPRSTTGRAHMRATSKTLSAIDDRAQAASRMRRDHRFFTLIAARLVRGLGASGQAVICAPSHGCRR